jgi:dimethylhistidine N-methyltransferase
MSKNVKNSDTGEILDLQSRHIPCPKSQQEFAIDVLLGLSHTHKWLPCKYIYDERGSLLFEQIMACPEYYLTDCEMEILKTYKKEIIAKIGKGKINLVELGAGSGEKTKILLQEMITDNIDVTFIPIDISSSAIRNFTTNLKKQLPGIKIKGLVSEYFKGIRWLSNLNCCTNVILFLGSNIGNFEPAGANVFLSSLWNACNDGDYLVTGFDLKKDIQLLLNAYNDSGGVTAEFNLNLLRRINNELGGNFDLKEFQYYSTFDAISGAMQSYLISRKKQYVVIDEINRMFSFKSWESIHTESSYKFLVDDIEKLASRNGFEIIEHFFDSKNYFVDSLWQVKKE